MCPVDVVTQSYGDSDLHILMVESKLPVTIFELWGNMTNAKTYKLSSVKLATQSYGYSDCHILISW